MVLFRISNQSRGGELVFRDDTPLGLPGRARRLALSVLERDESALESAFEFEGSAERPGTFNCGDTDRLMGGELDGEGETMNRSLLVLLVGLAVVIVPSPA